MKRDAGVSATSSSPSHKPGGVCAASCSLFSRRHRAGMDASSAGAIYRLRVSRASLCSTPDIGSIR
jgi:hypothetical protein